MKKILAILTVGILGVGLVACSNDKPVEPAQTPVSEVEPTPEVETPEIEAPEVEPEIQGEIAVEPEITENPEIEPTPEDVEIEKE